MVHSLFNRERVFRSYSFRGNKLVERVSAKEINVGNIFAPLGNDHFFSVFAYGKERNDFIVRTFRVKLNLTVLIGYAECFYGGLSRIYPIARIIDFFAERFRPDLAIPVGEIFKSVRIRHHNGNVLASLHRDVLQNGVHKRGVFVQIFIHRNSVHISRARQKLAYIHARYRRGKQSYGAKFGKSSADTVGNIERLITFRFGDFYKITRFSGSRRDNMILNVIAELFFKSFVNDKILRHSFGGGTALRYNVEYRFFNVDNIEKRSHSLGVYVVFYVKLRGFSVSRGEIVIMKVAKRLKYRYRSERASAYAEYDEILHIFSYIFSDFVYFRNYFSLIERKFRPAEPALTSFGRDFLNRFIRLYSVFVKFVFRYTLCPDKIFHHVVVIKP